MNRGLCIITAVTAVAGLILGGCSSTLTVDVSVLDPDYLDQYRASNAFEVLDREALIAKRAIAEDGPLGLSKIEAAGTEIQQQTNLVRDAIFKADPGAIQMNVDFGSQARSMMESRLRAARESLVEGIHAIESASTKSLADIDAAYALYVQAKEAFNTSRESLVSAVRIPEEVLALGDQIEGLQGDERAAVQKTANELQASINRSLEPAYIATAGLETNALSLRGDPLLGHVLRADESYWDGVSNRAHAFSFGANSDIAIVMEDIDKFTVKGLRVDSSSAAKATFATLGRVMDIAAVVSGVPIAGVLPDPPPAKASDPEAEVEEAKSRMFLSRTRARANAAASKRAAVELMNTILQETDATLTSPDDTTRTRIAERLRAAAQD